MKASEYVGTLQRGVRARLHTCGNVRHMRGRCAPAVRLGSGSVNGGHVGKTYRACAHFRTVRAGMMKVCER
jgi:hypothetical protein